MQRTLLLWSFLHALGVTVNMHDLLALVTKIKMKCVQSWYVANVWRTGIGTPVFWSQNAMSENWSLRKVLTRWVCLVWWSFQLRTLVHGATAIFLLQLTTQVPTADEQQPKFRESGAWVAREDHLRCHFFGHFLGEAVGLRLQASPWHRKPKVEARRRYPT